MNRSDSYIDTEGLSAAPPDQATTVACEVIRAVDGDTVLVEVKQRYRVRLIDCWAPETKGETRAAGLASKVNLECAIGRLGRFGTLSVPWNEDASRSWSLGRVLGRIWLGGEDLSEVQVNDGHASKVKAKD